MKLSKALSVFSAFILFQPLFASGNEACERFIPCGTYEGTGNWFDVSGNKKDPDDFNEKLVFTPAGRMGVRVQVYIYTGTEPKLWTDRVLRFDSDGAFRGLVARGKTAVTGICQNNVCTVSFYPVAVNRDGKSYVNSFVNILRFEGDTLTRQNMVMNGADLTGSLFQRSQLAKK